MSPDEAVSRTDDSWRLVGGWFDPLTAAGAARLDRQADRRLLVIVYEDADSLLPTAIRARMVAALGSVDLVTTMTPDGLDSLEGLERDDEGEHRRTHEFIELVRSRHS